MDELLSYNRIPAKISLLGRNTGHRRLLRFIWRDESESKFRGSSGWG